MFTYDEISLMAFSSNDVIRAWKEQVLEEERYNEHKRNKDQQTIIKARWSSTILNPKI